jgi:hypothetical protein
MQMIGFVAIAYLAASGLWTTTDPFVGKWKLDVARSMIIDRMEVEAVGPNRYTFRFEGGPAETILADGTDQPGLTGTTLSVKAEDARTLRVVRKKDGHIVISATWKVSEDGRTLRDAFTDVQSDGSTVHVDYVYRRMSGTSGFAGAWESATQPAGLKLELGIQPYGDKGLTFVNPGSVKSITFDGRDHAAPGSTDGLTWSGRRLSERAMKTTDRTRGKVDRTRAFELSHDGRTLTMTVRPAGRTAPDVFVFERE